MINLSTNTYLKKIYRHSIYFLVILYFLGNCDPSENKMPPLEEGQTPSVGIIYPPPEVRNIVDKTATFVARNGPEFEQRIKQQEVKFNIHKKSFYTFFKGAKSPHIKVRRIKFSLFSRPNLPRLGEQPEVLLFEPRRPLPRLLSTPGQ